MRDFYKKKKHLNKYVLEGHQNSITNCVSKTLSTRMFPKRSQAASVNQNWVFGITRGAQQRSAAAADPHSSSLSHITIRKHAPLRPDSYNIPRAPIRAQSTTNIYLRPFPKGQYWNKMLLLSVRSRACIAFYREIMLRWGRPL